MQSNAAQLRPPATDSLASHRLSLLPESLRSSGTWSRSATSARKAAPETHPASEWTVARSRAPRFRDLVLPNVNLATACVQNRGDGFALVTVRDGERFQHRNRRQRLIQHLAKRLHRGQPNPQPGKRSRSVDNDQPVEFRFCELSIEAAIRRCRASVARNTFRLRARRVQELRNLCRLRGTAPRCRGGPKCQSRECSIVSRCDRRLPPVPAARRPRWRDARRRSGVRRRQS